MTPKTLIEKIRGEKKEETSGNKPTENLIKPNPPSLSKIPAKMTEPDVGASLWASGNQMWNGTKGILTAKDKKKANQINLIINESNWITWSFW